MKFYPYPKKIRTIFIMSIFFTAFAIYCTSLALQYISPDDPTTAIFMQWRYPLIAFYLVTSGLGFYVLGAFGNWYVFTYSSIECKRPFKEVSIPWDAVEKIIPTEEPPLYLEIIFKKEYSSQFKGNLSKGYTFEKSDEAILEIEKYFQNPDIT